VYLDDCQLKRPSKWASDAEKAERLWKLYIGFIIYVRMASLWTIYIIRVENGKGPCPSRGRRFALLFIIESPEYICKLRSISQILEDHN
jgi:hypothetical protein